MTLGSWRTFLFAAMLLALAGFGLGLAYVTIKGRRGGSALAAAAVNALCGKPPA